MTTITFCSYEYKEGEHTLEIFDGEVKHIFEIPIEIPREDTMNMLKHKPDMRLLLGMIASEHKVEFKPPTLDQILTRQIRRMEIDTNSERFRRLAFKYYSLSIFGAIRTQHFTLPDKPMNNIEIL